MKIFKSDLKRALLNKRMLFSIIFGIAIILVGMIFEPIRSAINIYYDNSPDIDMTIKTKLIGNSFNKVTLWNFGNYFYLTLIPLICVFPFSTEYLKDKKSGFNKYMIIRGNYKNYILSKIVTTFLSGFICIFIITIFNLILVNILDSGNEFRSIFYDNIIASELSKNNFNWFILLHGFICSIMGGIYALIGLAVSSFVDKVLVAFITPFFIYYIGLYIMGTMNIFPLNPSIVPAFYYNEAVTLGYIIIQLSVLLIFSVISFVKNTYWSDIYE